MKNIDLSEYSYEELLKIKETVDEAIYSYEDGYTYICEIRSYGRRWTQELNNLFSVKELCSEYNGDDGIVDVYSTNPNISSLYNYGGISFITSKDDYKKWKNYENTKLDIIRAEEDLVRWETKDELPFRNRPTFEPFYTREKLQALKKEFENTVIDFVPPNQVC